MATTKQIKPFGSWQSPISGESLVQSSLRLGQIQIDGNRVIWTEGRPKEQGRTALMSWSQNQAIRELSPLDADVRTRAHEYGGGAFLAASSRLFYIENKDQQIYEILQDGSPLKISNDKDFRYADAVYDDQRKHLIVVGEDHTNPDHVENMLMRISLDKKPASSIIAKGHDFYSNPQLSPNGTQLIFLSWDHPNMPWDGTQLWMGDLDEAGNLLNLVAIAGGQHESIFQPLWDPNGNIYYISDKSDWWNIYEYSPGGTRCVLNLNAEFGLPQWVFGMSTYSVLSSEKLITSYRDSNGSHLAHLDVSSGKLEAIELPYTDIDQLHSGGNLIAFIGNSPGRPGCILCMEKDTGVLHELQQSAETDLPESYISKPQLISFETAPHEMSFAWYYPPRNPSYRAAPGEKPPLIVLSHGGPTAYSSAAFSLSIQFWTTRGFAIVDVNYSGSTGYGRKYRERLKGAWGIRDVQDCTTAAQFLVKAGHVDGDRLIIKGGSAGGFTTLAALTFTNVFTAGASYYGVGDLTRLARDTHKFESRYLDNLVGAYPAELQKYHDRSPLFHAGNLKCPVIFMQGLDDPVVPPNQAESMVAALKKNGIPVAYLLFEGESHGFRQASTTIKAIESELYFYSRIFNIEITDKLKPFEIFNLT